jgi:hypothetical protein
LLKAFPSSFSPVLTRAYLQLTFDIFYWCCRCSKRFSWANFILQLIGKIEYSYWAPLE